MQRGANVDLKWRSRCKELAYWDRVFIKLELPVTIVSVVSSINTDDDLYPWLMWISGGDEGIRWVACTLVVTLLMSIAELGTWAAKNLLKSTQMRQDLKKALKMALAWKIVNLGLAVVTVGIMLLTRGYLVCGAFLLKHTGLLYIVSKYIQELKGEIERNNMEE